MYSHIKLYYLEENVTLNLIDSEPHCIRDIEEIIGHESIIPYSWEKAIKIYRVICHDQPHSLSGHPKIFAQLTEN